MKEPEPISRVTGEMTITLTGEMKELFLEREWEFGKKVSAMYPQVCLMYGGTEKTEESVTLKLSSLNICDPYTGIPYTSVAEYVKKALGEPEQFVSTLNEPAASTPQPPNAR